MYKSTLLKRLTSIFLLTVFFTQIISASGGKMVKRLTGKKDQQAATGAKSARETNQDRSDNGINVGQPKQFDERTLTLMLQSLESRLAQTQFPDTSGLYGAVGRFGGGTADTSSMALRVTGPSVPSVTTTLGNSNTTGTTISSTEGGTQNTTLGSTSSTTSGGATNSNTMGNTTGSTIGTNTSNTTGGTTGTTQNMQQQTVQPGFAPPSAVMMPQTSMYPYQPQFGIASRDLLAEQTSLFYQIVNLRMLLDRPLNDRIKVTPGAPASAKPRRDQVVIGFQISIDAKYKDAVAEAELTVEGEDVSLVSLLPQKDTYNVASVTKDSKAFDVGAVVSELIGVGAAMGKTQESMYLVKDTDTVALERTSKQGATTFAWQFRPVLGRKTVEPGIRQVYALVSVPNIDKSNKYWSAKITATTKWRRYDRKTKTVGAEIKGSVHTSQGDYMNMTVASPNLTEGGLKPKLDDMTISDIGNGQVLITVNGEGFTPDTNIILGNKVIRRPEEGLTIANERRLMVIAPVQLLAQSAFSSLIIGRYGSTNFVRTKCFKSSDNGDCVRVDDPYQGQKLEIIGDFKPRDPLNSEVTIRLKENKKTFVGKDGKKVPYIVNFENYIFKNHPPVVTIGSRVFGFSDAPFISKRYKDTYNPNTVIEGCKDDEWCADLTFVAPTQLLANNTSLTFKELLWDQGAITVSFPKPNSFMVSGITTLGSNGEKTQLAIFGGGFSKDVKVFIGDTEFKQACAIGEQNCNLLNLNAENGATLITLSPTKGQIKDVNHILITQGTALPQTVALVSPPAATPKAKIISPARFVVPPGSSRRETLHGANLESIQKITTLGDVPISFELDKKDKTILYLDVTKSLSIPNGENQIKLIMKDNEVVFLSIFVE